MAEFEISQVWVYPVKSLGGVSVPSARITPGGSLAMDREWLVVDPAGHMLWQGDLPLMSLLDVSLQPGQLSIHARDGATFSLPVDHGGEAVSVHQYGRSFAGIDAGDAAAAWLGGHLGAPCRLVRIGPLAHLWPGLNPIHIVSEHSLRFLNAKLAETGQPAVELQRFRPNVVVAGTHDAFAEETAAVLAFRDAELIFREPCVRCELPNISRVDASRGPQPLKLIGRLSKTRPASKPASFGTYARASGERLAVGDRT